MSKPDVLVPGRVYYDSAGNKVRFEGELPSGDFCLTFLIEGCEECGVAEGPVVVYGSGYTLYTKPPMHQKHAELAALHEKIEAAKKELHELTHTIRTREKEGKEVLDRLKAYPSLRLLDEFMSGKIKERKVVIERSAREWKILPFEEALEYKDDWSRETGVKLITFFGTSNGDLEFRVNAYKDGSGTWSTFRVVVDDTEGERVVKEMICERIAWGLQQAPWVAEELDKKYPGLATAEQLIQIEQYRKESAKRALEAAAKRRVDANDTFEKAKIEYQQKWGTNYDDTNGSVAAST